MPLKLVSPKTRLHRRSAWARTAFLVCLKMLVTEGLGANPVSKPIIKGGLDVHVAPFAKIPDLNNKGAKIVSMTSLGEVLYVCTTSHIYQVYPKGFVGLYLDLRDAVKIATGRNLNLKNTVHGGLRSIAFHPKFWNNGLVYTSLMEDRPSNPGQFRYLSDVSDPVEADSVVVEWKYDFTKKALDPKTYRQVLRIGMPAFDHPIKQIAFRGQLLYIAHGDGSVKSATAGGGQRKDALGKILRINPMQDGARPYSVPADNPFVGNPEMLDEVYALGFRNPHNFCFSKNGLLIGVDAGRDNVEEINIVKKGANYGWSAREGTFVHKAQGGLITGIGQLPPDDAQNNFEYPVAQYGHDGVTGGGFHGTAIAGGCLVENGSPLSGLYFYTDFPKTGTLYYSKLPEMLQAVTKGTPSQLSQAPTRQASIFYDHDKNNSTPAKRLSTLGDVVRSDQGLQGAERADIRLGRGTNGELYFSSKTNGKIYLITSSVPGGPGGQTA